MRIGIDLRPLQNNNRFRGIGRYLENVLRALAPMTSKDMFVFYVEKRSPLPKNIISLFNKVELRYVAPSKIKHIKYVRALARPQVKVSVKSNDVDVFFQADSWLGIPKNIPTVAVLYDLIPLFFKLDKESRNLSGVRKYKQMFGEAVQNKFYKEMLASYKGARALLAISESTKKDYLQYIDKKAANKIHVTLLAGSEGSFPKITTAQSAKTRQKYGLGDRPFLLYVGGVDLRKNIKSLAEDFFELKKTFPDLKMIMVGKEFGLKRDLRTVGWTQVLEKHPKQATDILTPGYVPDDELANLYHEAVAFTFPSRYEGFGLPALEAMHLRCPVICYDNSSLPEVVGSAAILVKDGRSLAPAVKKLMDDPELRASLIKKGEKQAQNFTWVRTAKITLKVIREVASYN